MSKGKFGISKSAKKPTSTSEETPIVSEKEDEPEVTIGSKR